MPSRLYDRLCHSFLVCLFVYFLYRQLLLKHEAFEKCLAHSPLRAAATLAFTGCRYCRTPPLSHAACASMSTTTTTITTTMRDRGPLWPHRMGPISSMSPICPEASVGVFGIGVVVVDLVSLPVQIFGDRLGDRRRFCGRAGGSKINSLDSVAATAQRVIQKLNDVDKLRQDGLDAACLHPSPFLMYVGLYLYICASSYTADLS